MGTTIEILFRGIAPKGPGRTRVNLVHIFGDGSGITVLVTHYGFVWAAHVIAGEVRLYETGGSSYRSPSKRVLREAHAAVRAELETRVPPEWFEKNREIYAD
jgi:hypothetical protein